ncbi:MAG: hypothetical protein GX638_10675 [Crenarchaeota archaeon]|nr:hypothetical protein [Thermoproteota archaeon]
MNIFDVKTDVFTPNSEVATLYYLDKKGIPHQLGKIFIHPFIPAMIHANNINVILDENNNIVSGQIGKYDYENGLHVICFDQQFNTKKY